METVLDFRGPAAVLVVRHEHERWVDIAANAGECLPLLPETPFHNTKLHQIYQTPFALRDSCLELSYLVRYLIHHCLELASLGIR